MPTIKAFYANTAIWDANEALIEAGQELGGQSLSFPTLWDIRQDRPPQNHQATAAVYIYELQASGESHTGVWALTPSSDIRDGHIKGYEQGSVPGPELIAGYLKGKRLNTDPALIAYPADLKIKELIDRGKRAVIPKTIGSEEQEHRLWAVSEPTLLEELIQAFGKLGTVFLAGGHQHTQAGANLPDLHHGDDDLHLTVSSCFSALYMAEDQLRSRPCHQFLKPCFPVDPESFFQVIGKDFEILAAPGNRPVEPERAHQFGLYLDGCWYLLLLKQQALGGASFTGRLDGNILYSHLLLPARLLSGAAQGISGIGGLHAMQELVEQLNQDRSMIAFTLFPASLNQIMSVAYTDGTLAPATTWIEPKAPAGLLGCLIQTEMP